MTQRGRKILFIACVVLFALAAPSAILYSQGYRLDLDKRSLTPTGAFYFKPEPTGTQIYLDGKLAKETSFLFNSALVDNLLPKTYSIEIQKEGYYAWRKILEIQGKRVTEAKNIFLFPKNPAFAQTDYNNENFQKILLAQKPVVRGAIPKNIIKTALAYQVLEDKIFWLDKNGVFYKNGFNGEVLGIMNAKPLDIKGETSFKIKVFSEQRIFLIKDGALYYLNGASQEFQQISPKIADLEISPDHKKIAYFDNYEIWIAYLEDIDGQPRKKSGDKTFITRFSEKIGQVVWLNNYYIIFNVGNKIKIAEIDDRDGINIINLAAYENPKIFWDQNNKNLYISSRGNLYVTEALIP